MSLLRGTVTDNQDPMQRGRCRVYVWGMHKEEDENLPWAETAGSTMFGLHKGVGYSGVLQVGTTVWVQFEQNDVQCPVICGVFVGHDAESMAEISPENSDFHPDAKGDKYGKVWMFNTPEGNSFKMDDADPRIHITTPNGFELDLDDKNRRIRLGTPCGPEVVMECDGKIQVTSGCAKITMDGCKLQIDADQMVINSNVQVNGHLTAQGVFAPNLCYCNSPGDPAKGGNQTTSKEKEKSDKAKKCSPTIGDNGETSCNTDHPANNTLDGLSDEMIQLVDEAKNIYIDRNGTKEPFKICEGKMTPERYQCLSASGISVPEQMVCGYGVQAVAHDEECDAANASPSPETRNPGECGGKFEALEALKSMIAGAESESAGGYNAYNNGTAGVYIPNFYNFANMTIGEIQSKLNLPKSSKERILVWGKYQMRLGSGYTTEAAMKWAGLTPQDKGTPENQEKMFGALITKTRPKIEEYLIGNGSLEAAQISMAQQWASLGVPKAMKGANGLVNKDQSYYAGSAGNAAHVSSDTVGAKLKDLKATVDEVANSKGINKQQALACILGKV